MLCSSLLGAWWLWTRLLYGVGLTWRTVVRRPRRYGAIDRDRIRSILLIRLDQMGDFVLFTAILKPLREAFPEAHIALVLCDWLCPLAELCPYVDEVIPFPAGGPRWRQFILGPWRAFRIAARLRRRYDLVIHPRFDRDIRGAAFLGHFSLASWVVGYPSSTESFKAAANRGYDRFYTHLLPAPAGVLHELDRNRAALELLGIPHNGNMPEVWISPHDRSYAERLLRQQGWRPGCILICLGIHAGHARRRWPPQLFGEVARQLSSEALFLTIGDRRDRQTAELLRPVLGPRLVNLAGRAPLRVSAAALEQSCLYVGNDSGPMHLAAALGKPVVEITCHSDQGDPAHFQSPDRFQPVGVPSVVLAPAQPLATCGASCLAGTAHCIRQIPVEDVVEAVATVVEMQRQEA